MLQACMQGKTHALSGNIFKATYADVEFAGIFCMFSSSQTAFLDEFCKIPVDISNLFFFPGCINLSSCLNDAL